MCGSCDSASGRRFFSSFFPVLLNRLRTHTRHPPKPNYGTPQTSFGTFDMIYRLWHEVSVLTMTRHLNLVVCLCHASPLKRETLHWFWLFSNPSRDLDPGAFVFELRFLLAVRVDLMSSSAKWWNGENTGNPPDELRCNEFFMTNLLCVRLLPDIADIVLPLMCFISSLYFSFLRSFWFWCGFWSCSILVFFLVWPGLWLWWLKMVFPGIGGLALRACFRETIWW